MKRPSPASLHRLLKVRRGVDVRPERGAMATIQVGDVATAAELATYVVEKGNPFLVVVE
jgi:hypothetical protein